MQGDFLPYILEVWIRNQADGMSCKALTGNCLGLRVTDPDFVRQVLDSMAHEALTKMHPVIKKGNCTFSRASTSINGAPFQVRLPTGATQQPIRPGNTLFQRQGLHYLTEPPFKNRNGGAAKHKGALQPLLRDIARKDFCTTGIVGYNCNLHYFIMV
jgi:hypothetical protein